MSLIYHLEKENDSSKNLSIRCESPKKIASKEQLFSLATSPNEKKALERLLKNASFSAPTTIFDFSIHFERSWELLKLLGGTGRVFVENKKIVIDPFLAYEIRGDRYKLGSGEGSLKECNWVCSAWILQGGFLREAHVVPVPPVAVEPLPLLLLTDRQGAFADLWFDYGAFGTVAAHDPRGLSYRNPKMEKQWQQDLLETDFIKKIVDRSHYYCPLNKVAKSLTFLLEIGWTVRDAQGKQVVRQKPLEMEVTSSEKAIHIRGKILFENHEVNLKDLTGAFNRREHFISLSPQSVMLFDREPFAKEWADLSEEQIVGDTMLLPKQRVGLLDAFLKEEAPYTAQIKEKIIHLLRREPSQPILLSKNFRGNLFPYQEAGLKWLQFLEEGAFSGLLADEMGLGKTVQLLAFFSTLKIAAPILVVAPTSLLFNWQREIERFVPELSIYRHEGQNRLRNVEEIQKQVLILTSYALLRIDAELLTPISYQMVVLDEAQNIKNADSLIATLCCHLQSEQRIAITGTPIENRLEDLWSLFHFLQPDLLGDRQALQAALSQPHLLARIKSKIRPFLLRRTKDEVALDLPQKLEQTVFVEMSDTERILYDNWVQRTRQGLLKKVNSETAATYRMAILEAILRLRQLCAHPLLVEKEETELSSAKLDRLLADVEEVMDEEKKVLIYSQFTTMLKIIEGSIKQRGWKYVYLDGSTKDRERVIEQFQNDPDTHIFLISLKAGGVGLNLTAADYVFLYDPWWNEAVERQAIDRAHRVGKKGIVIARRYISALTIEEKIMRLKAHKTALSKHLLEGEGGYEQWNIEDLLQLLEE